MTRKTHIVVGLATTLPILYGCPFYAILGIIGATLPDIDIRLGIKHRTITHSLLMLFSTTLLVFTINKYISIVFFINFLLHLILDSFTKMGVPLFYPFNKKYYGPRILKTGDKMDYFISLLAIYCIFSYL